MPRVFISYSWDSDEHKDRVRALATFLRASGIDARLDQWENGTPPDGWPAWCSRQVLKADVIAVICTQRYHARFHGLESSRPGGVIWESQTIQNLAYFRYLRAGFLPIVLHESDGPYVPALILGAAVRPLQWPSDGDWSRSGILERIDPDHEASARKPLPIPEPHSPAQWEETAGPSIVDDSVCEMIDQIQSSLETLSEQIQRSCRPQYIPISKQRSESADPSLRELRYAERWLDYQAPRQLGALERWVDDPASFSWWAVIAPGGTGKSRLALELIDRVASRNWEAFFLTDMKWMNGTCRGWRPTRATLLVVDYAVAKQEQVLECLQILSSTLTAERGFPKVRLLLLDRSSGFAPGFALPQASLPDWNTIRKGVRKFLYKPESPAPDASRQATAVTQPLVEREELIELGNPPRADWPKILGAAMYKAAGHKGAPPEIPPLSKTTWWDHVARLTADGRMLYLELLAVALARTPDVANRLTEATAQEALLDAMIDDERQRRWPQAWPAERGGAQKAHVDPDFKAVVHAIGFATLVRGMPIAEPKDWQRITEATSLPDSCHAALCNYLRVEMHSLTDDAGQSSRRVRVYQPLEPDLLGERLILRLSSTTEDDGEVRPAEVQPATWIEPAMRCNPVGVAQTLNLIADDFPDHPATAVWLGAALKYMANNRRPEAAGPVAPAIAFLLAIAAAKLAVRSNLPADHVNDLFAIAEATEQIHIAVMLGFTKLVPHAAGHSAGQWDNLAHRLSWESRFGHKIGASATVSIIAAYGIAQRFDDLERWASMLSTTAGRFPNDHEIQLELAKATVNTISFYGRAKRFDDLERWASTLSATAERFPEDRDIQLECAKAAVNASNSYGRAKRFDGFERWVNALSATAGRFPNDHEIQLISAKAAANVISSYGMARKFGDLERWATTLSPTAERFPEDREINLEWAKAAVNVISSYGIAQKFDDLERWATTLSATAERFPEDHDINLELAKASFNAINDYGTAQKCDDLERWAGTLSATAERFPEDCEIQRTLAEAAVNAISYYGTAQKFDDLERWAGTLYVITERLPEDCEIQRTMAKASFNAINDYGTAQKFDDLERWASTLSAIAERFPEDGEIQRTLAEAAVNAISYYGTAQKFDDLERWATKLSATAEWFPEDREIQLILAQAAFNAINGYGTAQKCDDLERWASMLSATAGRFPNDHEIQLELAKAAVNTISFYGRAKRFDDLERWTTTLSATAKRFPEDRKIQLTLTKAAVNVISSYGIAQKFDDLERWATTLSATAERFPEDRELHLELAKAAVNAISDYGTAQKFDDLERWATTLSATAERFPEDRELHLELAKAAVNAISDYGTAQKFDDLERWATTLSATAERFSEDREIQLALGKAAVNAINNYGTAQKFDDVNRWRPITVRALAASAVTTDVLGACLGIIGNLADTAPPAATVLLAILTEYWPGFLVPTQDRPIPLCVLAQGERADQRRETLAKAYGLTTRLEDGSVSTIAEATPILQELWPLRMYLPDRGDALVPILEQCRLVDLVAEAARDPWRSGGEPR